MTNKCTKNKSHATHLDISARLTAVALTKLGDVSTVAKTLVEALNVLYDSVQLRFPRHATRHRSIYRRGGTRR